MYKSKQNFQDKFKKDRNYRFNQLIINSKQLILKNKFNQAYDNMYKYYLQNKNNISNQEVYQIAWQCCRSMTKKIYRRLIKQNKRNVQNVTEYHIDHLYSLYLSIYSILEPQVVHHHPQFFLNLNIKSEFSQIANILHYKIIFQRKKPNFFLRSEAITAQINKLVKYYLRIINITLIYKAKRSNEHKQIQNMIKGIQDIYKGFKEHLFALQYMDYQLIKLSLIQNGNEQFKDQCQYRLPLGFINQLYSFIRTNNNIKIGFYLKKLNSFIVLSFKNLSLPIQQMYIACSEMMYIYKTMQRIQAFQEKHSNYLREIQVSKMLKIKRTVTIEIPDSLDDDKLKNITTNRQISSSKLQSSKGIIKIQNQLKYLSQKLLMKIDSYLSNQRQLKHIILTYFQLSHLIKLSNSTQQDNFAIIKNIKINQNIKNINNQGQRRVSKRMQNDNIQKQMKVNTFKMLQMGKNKKSKKLDLNDRFIAKNIIMVNKQLKKPQQDHNALKKIIQDISISQIQMINESDSDQQDGLKHLFQIKRRQKIKQNNQHMLKKVNTENKVITKSLSYNKVQQAKYCVQNQKDSHKNGQKQQLNTLNQIVSFVINRQIQYSGNNNEQIGPATAILSDSSYNRRSYDGYMKKYNCLLSEIQNEHLNTKRAIQQLQIRNNMFPLIQKNGHKDLERLKSHECFMENMDLQMIKKVGHKSTYNDKQKKYKTNKLTLQPSHNKERLQLKKRPNKDIEMTIDKMQNILKRPLQNHLLNNQSQKILLSSIYDNLRRDLTKNRLLQNNKGKTQNKKHCKTIFEVSHDDKHEQR